MEEKKWDTDSTDGTDENGSDGKTRICRYREIFITRYSVNTFMV